MNNLVYILSIILLTACAEKKEYNKTIPDEEEETVMLINWANEEGLKGEPFGTWYNENYSNYQVDQSSIETLKPLLSDIKMKIFMGTWCSDSQLEIPSFFKIIKAADYNKDKIELITVDREKTTPLGLEKGLDIEYVPTIIFYKDGKEINRIVESPIKTLEMDMIAILSGQPYKHTYAE